MSFFSKFFSRRPKVDKVAEIVEEKINSRFVQFEERLNTILADAFTRVELKNKVPFTVKAVIVNDTITAFTPTGQYEGHGDRDVYIKVLAAQSDEEVKNILIPNAIAQERRIQEEKERLEQLAASVQAAKEVAERKEREEKILNAKRWEYCQQLIEETGEFKEVGNGIQMVGIPLSMPQVLVDEFVKLIAGIYSKETTEEDTIEYDAKYDALKNFWMWCSLNPNPQARQDLFKFLKNHDLKVNKNGFFFTYRRVQSVDQDRTKESVELSEFVNEQFLKIRTKWKKNPANFVVTKKDDVYYLTEASKMSIPTNHPEWVGNLKELYEKESETEELTYTDAYTRKMKIVIGKEVRISRDECNSDNGVECSRGLHTANKNFDFQGNGDTPILCLINPQDVVSVPKYDANKMRSCAYLPVATLNAFPEASFLESADVLELADEYMVDQVEKLKDMLNDATFVDKPNSIDKSVFAEEEKEVVVEEPVVPPVIIDHLVPQANSIKTTLARRVVKI